MAVVALFAGFTQMARSEMQPVRAIKVAPADMKKPWTIEIKDESGTVVSRVEFTKNTDRLLKSKKWDGKDLSFDFSSGKTNTVYIYKAPRKEVEANTITFAFSEKINAALVPKGAQLKISDTKVDPDRSKVKAAKPAGPSIKVNNKLNDFRITVSFAQDNTDLQPTKPFDKTIKRGQTLTIPQPQNKNFVMITLYDVGSRDYKIKSSFNLNNPLFSGKRIVTIDGVTSNPDLYLNEKQLVAQ